MNSRQLLKYAKENGYDSVMFDIVKGDKHLATAKFLDAYYEFIRIPVIGEGFIRLSDLEDAHGYDLEYNVLNEQEYRIQVSLDFIVRGKEIPEEFSLEDEVDQE